MDYVLGMGIYVQTVRRIPETSLFYKVTAHYDCDDEGARLAQADEEYAAAHVNETIVSPPSLGHASLSSKVSTYSRRLDVPSRT